MANVRDRDAAIDALVLLKAIMDARKLRKYINPRIVHSEIASIERDLGHIPGFDDPLTRRQWIDDVIRRISMK